MKRPPEILSIYSYCKEFGWTIDEFYKQPKKEIEQFAVIMTEIAAIKAEQQRQAEAKSRSMSRR